MVEFFNLTRFTNVLRLLWTENKFLFLMLPICLFGLECTIYYVGSYKDEQLGVYLFSAYKRYQFGMLLPFLVTCCLMTVFLLSRYNTKNTMTAFLMIPASPSEKLLANILIIFIGFPILFLSVFSLVDFSFVWIIKYILEKKGHVPNELIATWTLVKQSKALARSLSLLPGTLLSAQGFILVCAFTFKKNMVVKTIVTGFFSLFFLYLVVDLNVTLFLDGLGEIKVGYDESRKTNELIHNVALVALDVLLPLYLLLIAYFKLKEMEV